MIISTITYSCDVCGKTKIIRKEAFLYDDPVIEEVEGFEYVEKFLDDYYLWNEHWQTRMWEDIYACSECKAKSDARWEKKREVEKTLEL